MGSSYDGVMLRFAYGPLIAASLSTWVGRAMGQDGKPSCGDPEGPGPIAFTPAAGAQGVTINAPIAVEYTPGYFEDSSIGADPEESLVVRDGGRFRFFAASSEFAGLEGQSFSNPREAEKAAMRQADSRKEKPRSTL